MNKLLKSKKYGSAMVLAVLAIVILAAMGLGLLSLGNNSRLSAVRGTFEIQARAAADAGLAKALYEMNEKLKVTPWSDSSLPSETDSAIQDSSETYSYTVTKSGSDYIVTVTGNCGRVQKQISCTLAGQGPFSFALFGNQSVSLIQSSTIDQYNTTSDSPPLSVGTNSIAAGAISLIQSATINGNAVVGVGGNPDTAITTANSSKVTGEKTTLSTPNTLVSVTVPSAIASQATKGNLTTAQTITTSGKYTTINLAGSTIVTISGDVTLYVTGIISLAQSSQLNVNSGSSLTLYMGGNYSTTSSSRINNLALNSQNLQMYGLDTCTSFSVASSSGFYGVVYAPNAAVSLATSIDIYGSVIAKSISTSSSPRIHYDASLRNLSSGGGPTAFEVKKWHEQ